MKYSASIYIYYRNRKLFKIVNVSKVIDKTHAANVLKSNLKKLHPDRRTEVLTLNEIN